MQSPKPKILVIDDDPDVLSFLEILLQKSGFTVLTADHGEKGLFLLAEQPDIALILLDWMMPGMDGIQVLEELSNQENPPPVLMLTALGDRKDIDTALRAGAKDYMQKPIDRETLLFKIKNLLELDRENARRHAALRRAINLEAKTNLILTQITSKGCVLQSTFGMAVGSIFFFQSVPIAERLDLPWDYRFTCKVTDCEGRGNKHRIEAAFLALPPEIAGRIDRVSQSGGWTV